MSSETSQSETDPTVATRALGATDVRVSEIALGCWGLAAQSYGKVEAAQFEATVRAAWDAGITTFDVAPMWGNGQGERRLGLALGEDLAKAVIIGRVELHLTCEELARVLGSGSPGAIRAASKRALLRLAREMDRLEGRSGPTKASLSGQATSDS